MIEVTLDEAYEGIVESYYTMLMAATEENGLLEGVNSIIRGDRSRPTPKTPTIWIFPMPSMNNQSASIKEDWTLPMQLTAIVQNTDPMEGYYEAFKLASKARSVILKDRKLGLEYVRDTVSKSFSSTNPPNKKKNLYAHFVLLDTRFNVLER